MKKIKLRSGLFTLVDDDDFKYLNQFKWYGYKDKTTSYVIRNKTVKDPLRERNMARLIMNTPKGMEVDHVDHNGLNNQKSNLRNCTRSQNCANRKPWSKSGYMGVYSFDNTIMSHIKINGKIIYLGTFKTNIDAAKAYDKAAKKYHGEFANLNFK